jgi:hypothetical protein
VRRIIEAHWEFLCPECGLGHHELGRLARDHEIFCEVCDHETGRVVKLDRWLPDLPAEDQARLRVALVA